ncbi:hypothetical protein B0J14DRAFT_566388 [Halenospora varia]|nr:hypothetical protein B0J14DRAFT_566388 [Halenospora varia]
MDYKHPSTAPSAPSSSILPSMPPKSPTTAKPLTSPATTPSATSSSAAKMSSGRAKISSAALPSYPFRTPTAAQSSNPYVHPPFFRGVKPAFLAKHPGLCFVGAAAAATGFFIYNSTKKEVAMEKKRNSRVEREVDCLSGEIRRNLSGK